MDPSKSSDVNVEIESSDNNPNNLSETPSIQTPVDSISTEGNTAIDSVPPPDPSKGDSNTLDDSEKRMQPQVLTPPDEASSSDVITDIDKEQESVQISLSSENSDKATPYSLLAKVPCEEPENRNDVVAPIQEGPLSPSPISPCRSSLSSKGPRARHRKRVSFNEKRDVPFIPIWPRSDEFTAVVGEEAVKRYVRESWKLDDSWLHCVDYLGEDPPSSKRHSYRAKFSQPTRRRPIPAHTASVYFTLVADCEGEALVQVWWVLEGQRLVHRPEEGEFREQWLKDILEAKAIICSETLF